LFPGFEAVFDANFSTCAARSLEIPDAELDEATLHADPKQRAWRTVEIYHECIEKITRGDVRFSLVICIVPDYVWRRCRPWSVVAKSQRVGIRPSTKRVSMILAGQQSFFDEGIVADAYAYSPDFRRQLKARCLHFGIPIQIIRESTLSLNDKGDDGR